MGERMRHKKAISQNLTTILLVVGIVLVVALILVNFSPTARSFIDSLGKMLFGSEPPAESKYFESLEFGFLEGSKMVPYPSGCTINGNTLVCDKGSQISFFVKIKNLGTLERDFYPAPHIGKDCKTKVDCKSLEPIDNFEPCTIGPDQSKDCKGSSKYTLDESGKFRVFSGARCDYNDCPQGTMNIGNNVYVINSVQYYNIEVLN
jgi:hypothetical protein